MALPRVFISTDLRLSSEEKDDAQSLIHALMYQDKMNIVGISGTASKWGHQDGLLSDIDKILDVYGEDQAKLEARSAAFKSVAELKAVTWQGATDTAPSAGWSNATDSSKAIISEAKAAAAARQTLNVLTWGGETDLAQALHDDPSIAPHVRFFNISNQDAAAHAYIKGNFMGDLDMWVDNQSTFRGVYQTPTSSGIIKGWHQENADGHGALGDLFADLSESIFNESGVKMGDSPTVLRFLSGNQNDPSKESWGGEFVKVSDRYWTDNASNGLDFDRSGTDGARTIYEDRDAWVGDFAKRFDWLDDADPADAVDDVITVRVSGDAYRSDPSFALMLDGRTLYPTNVVTADHADGAWQTFTYKGDFVAAGNMAYKVGVRFTNDAYKAGVGDRNLYVDEIVLNNVSDDRDASLNRNATATWDLTGVLATSPAQMDDVITLKVSGDAYLGGPTFTVMVNGHVVGSSGPVTADNGEGEWETFTFKGDFDLDGTDRVGVQFTNDAYEAGAGDRNLYVDAVTLNDDVNATNVSMTQASTEFWDF
jgi:hypothetical protein